ncbi:MAG: glutamate--tRNA ligase, partial [Candidatus Omnitrophica bacterium]|nr:glutamate--tRNA ligase [Candidatus Omnitrophota bacterium]
FKSPQTNIFWYDLVKGKIEFDGSLFDDLVIMKSNGTPTYSFACVVDDGSMEITHIIRGEDHISNTPKQLPLYDALGFKAPKFAHIPLILGEDRSRLSKRHGATSIREFKKAGYLPEAMINYLSLLGWSPGNNQELITLPEMVKKFSVKKIQTTNAVFDTKKMDWMNGEYIRGFDTAKLSDLFFATLEAAGKNVQPYDRDWRCRFAELYRKRVFLLHDLVIESAFFFEKDIVISDDGMEILKKDSRLAGLLDKYADELSGAAQFDHEYIESISRTFMEREGVSGKEFIHPARIAATGRTVSPGFFETLSLLGKETVVSRLKQAAEILKTSAQSGV